MLTSPNFPDVYDNNDYCLWTIAVTEGHKINVSYHQPNIPRIYCIVEFKVLGGC